VKKEQNGRKILRRLKPTVGCNATKRRRSGRPRNTVSQLVERHCATIRKVAGLIPDGVMKIFN
jgi:hypothetical protein